MELCAYVNDAPIYLPAQDTSAIPVTAPIDTVVFTNYRGRPMAYTEGQIAFYPDTTSYGRPPSLP